MRIVHAVTNLAGEMLAECSSEAESINYETIDKLLARLVDSYENIKAAGIGIPGIVHNGVIGACDIKELSNVTLVSRLRASYDLEFTVENDMNLATYGFYKKQVYDAALLIFGAALGTVDVVVNIQAVIVEKASGKVLMIFSILGCHDAGKVRRRPGSAKIRRQKNTRLG